MNFYNFSSFFSALNASFFGRDFNRFFAIESDLKFATFRSESSDKTSMRFESKILKRKVSNKLQVNYI